ncbi:DUF2459 domain-containing protein [Rubritepida flocculans]|uniref:DUF2459 domain-containing protein n=1 Tax=Rubritepida flocculans TaxID=182403 RepID=UPI00040678EB|nr:DUF2459 domain-containing protein [Rubritepida flocculans]
MRRPDRLPRRAALALPLALPACALAPAPPPAAGCGPGAPFFAYARDWHSEVVVPAAWLPDLAPLAPGAGLVMLGFGQREFFMADRPGLAEALAALAPGPAVIRARFLDAPPRAEGDAELLALRGAREGLVRFLAAAFARDAAGRLPPPLLSLPPARHFLAAARRYSLAYTCNSWTAEALAAAGLPVAVAGTLLRGQVMAQARALSCAAHG